MNVKSAFNRYKLQIVDGTIYDTIQNIELNEMHLMPPFMKSTKMAARM